MAKGFTAIIIIANLIMGLLLYLSSQSVLTTLSSEAYPVTFSVGIFSIEIGYAPSLNPVPQIVWLMPNYPSYVFVLFLIVNACFIIKLLISKESKQNNSENNAKP
jgi:hypothetical protein